MRSALLMSESTGRCSCCVARQARPAAMRAPAAASTTARSHVSRVRPALTACSRPLRLTRGTGAAGPSETVTVASVSGMLAMTVRTGALACTLDASGGRGAVALPAVDMPAGARGHGERDDRRVVHEGLEPACDAVDIPGAHRARDRIRGVRGDALRPRLQLRIEPLVSRALGERTQRASVGGA